VKALNMAVVFKQLAAAARAFGGDSRGVILPYVAIMLVVIVGIAVLALDGARGMSLQTQLQHAADALALTGAAELDGTSSAITRATNAIANNNTVINTTLPGMGNQTVQLASAPLFLSPAHRWSRTPFRPVLRVPVSASFGCPPGDVPRAKRSFQSAGKGLPRSSSSRSSLSLSKLDMELKDSL